MTWVASLDLTRFRCYESLRLDSLSAGLVVLTGPNGAGKTNILEALSFLVPGRGLRGAAPETVHHRDSPSSEEGWAVAAELAAPFGPLRIGTGWDPRADRMVARLEGRAARSRASAAEFLSVVWLTPQMDRLFLDSSGTRRRFFDRLVYAFDPGHAGRVARYENATAQRARLLREGRAEPAWLESLESQMAQTGVAIAAARVDFLRRLREAVAAEPDDTPFPRAALALEGVVEADLESFPALACEDRFLAGLRHTREADARTGGAGVGPHRTDLVVHHAAKAMPAAQCSTGEQKALLIGLVLAHARLIRAERGAPPVLLLDEVAAHLDPERRQALFAILQRLGGQSWLTGTDAALFAALPASSRRLRVAQARVLVDE